MRLPALVLLCALALAGCSASQDAGLPGQGFVAGDGTAEVVPVDDREAAPAVDAETLDGEQLRLDDLRGGPVIVNFWASWCGPCAKEAPDLQAVSQRYADDGVTIVGVNVKDDVAAARNFERDFGVTYDSWYDQPAAIAASFGGIGPAALPSTIVLDAEHRVAARLFGAVDEVRLSALVDAVLAEDGS